MFRKLPFKLLKSVTLAGQLPSWLRFAGSQ
ncbi:hypothetical protein [Klebsiella phage Kpn74]|uniref:Uncharacterized protein n=1 Tax=Klebsiella phage Kpn74 TaxID=3044026 RepID=A0AAT9V5S5_9CAUD|nr:hypothetical protein [Klebsiella phage Kpn74]